MYTHKFYLENLNGSNDFTLWKMKMRALLAQQGYATTLEGETKLPKDMADEKKVDILKKAYSAIMLSLTNEVLREVLDQTTASVFWVSICDMYQNNSITNMLYQKQRLCTLKMYESTHVKDHLDNFNHIILNL